MKLFPVDAPEKKQGYWFRILAYLKYFLECRHFTSGKIHKKPPGKGRRLNKEFREVEVKTRI